MCLLRSWILSIAIALTACGGGAPPRAADTSFRIPLEVYDFTLPNGMRVILDEKHWAPVAAVHVRYKVGSKDDPAERGGLAHLFEHLMFTARGDEPGALALLQSAGATEVNGATSEDSTDYYETVPRGALEWAFWFEARRMASMPIEQAALDRERHIIENEYRQHYENKSGSNLFQLRANTFFGAGHPYAHPTIGTVAELRATTVDDLRAFRSRFYRPGNAVLSVVGSFDRREVVAWLGKYFAPIPNAAAAPPIRSAPPTPLIAERRLVASARVTNGEVVLTYAAPPSNSPELPALLAMCESLANGMDNMLVKDRTLARAVWCDYHPLLLGSMLEFHVRLLARTGEDADFNEVLRVVDDAIFNWRPTDFPQVNHRLNRHTVEAILDLESFANAASVYARHDDFFQNPLHIARRLDAVQRTRRADALDARDKYLRTKKRLVTFVRNPSNASIPGVLL